jgi:hypothetical protein
MNKRLTEYEFFIGVIRSFGNLLVKILTSGSGLFGLGLVYGLGSTLKMSLFGES